MNRTLQCALAVSALVAASHAAAQITFYEGEGLRGRSMTTDRAIDNFKSTGMNDKVSSLVVDHGRWEVCEHAHFKGRCYVLRRGSYTELRSMGMDNQISSVRPVDRDRRYSNEWNPQPVAVAPMPVAPEPAPDYQWRRRPNERIYEAPVTSVRAVVGPPNQRCWVERQQVAQPAPRSEANVGGAVLGGIIGGVLGHQVGKGSGKDAATGVGAVAGAVIGANAGRDNSGGTVMVDRDVQRCQQVASTKPEYWDVTYNFRGIEHRVQMSAPPGATIAVNGNGEPRQ